MKYKTLFLTTFLCCLLAGLKQLHAQVTPDAPKTSTTIKGDSLKDVQILHAVKFQMKRVNDSTDLQILVGDVKLRQGNTLFFTDSCIINNSQHQFEAFGHVHINDSDTTNIYSDYLKYLTDKKIAYFNGNVRLTDGHGELTTPDMDYDMNTKIGTYTHGGKVINKKSVLTSDEGYYYADLKDVYFKKHVILKDPAYDLRADSLLYSTAFETVRFITKTVIIDSNKRTITTSEGYYDLKQGKAEFGKRPVVRDGKITITGERIRFDDSLHISQAVGNAIIVDSINGTTIFAGEIFRNTLSEAILATKKPLMIIRQDKDSIYITADTLFSARLTDLSSRPSSFKRDSISVADSAAKENLNFNVDSFAKKGVVSIINAVINSPTALQPALVPVTDSIWKKLMIVKRDSIASVDSIRQQNLAIRKPEPGKKEMLPGKRTLLNNSNKLPADSLSRNVIDTLSTAPRDSSFTGTKDSLRLKDLGLKRDSVGRKDTAANRTPLKLSDKDSTNRYFEAYRHVRIFTDSLQAVSDSMFYSFHDSTFHLYYDPVIWSQGSQITGDTVHLFTKNKKIDRMQVVDNSMLVNKLDKEAYNQVKSSRIDAYFFDGNIDSVRAKGSAEYIYYLQDKDSAYTGINQSTSDLIDVYFLNKELYKVIPRSQVKGTVWPIRQKSPSEMRLPNFRWLEARRPKTKFELME